MNSARFLVCVLFTFSACVKSRLMDNTTHRGFNRTVVQIDCDQELRQSSIPLYNTAENFSFTFAKTCLRKDDTVKTIASYRKGLVIFVIDITESMKDVLLTIKQNLLDFSRRMEESNWQVKFAAVGFRDSVNEMLFTEKFAYVKELLQTISSWSAYGGQDYPEGGQLALQKALALLQAGKAADEAVEAQEVETAVFYTTDAPMYQGNSQNNFSITDLSKNFKNKEIKFYYSVSPEVQSNGDIPAPQKQITDFIEASGIWSKNLSFPITRSEMLDSFADDFVKVTDTKNLSCSIKSAVLETKPTQKGSMSRSQLDLTKSSSQVVFTTSPDPTVTEYTLTIERCCAIGTNLCAKVKTSQFDLNFSKQR